jgi:hypothetical protein
MTSLLIDMTSIVRVHVCLICEITIAHPVLSHRAWIHVHELKRMCVSRIQYSDGRKNSNKHRIVPKWIETSTFPVYPNDWYQEENCSLRHSLVHRWGHVALSIMKSIMYDREQGQWSTRMSHHQYNDVSHESIEVTLSHHKHIITKYNIHEPCWIVLLEFILIFINIHSLFYDMKHIHVRPIVMSCQK